MKTMYSIILLQLYYLMLNGLIISQEYNTNKQIYKSTASPVAQWCKNLPAMQETRVRSLGQEDSLERKRQPTPVFLPGESHGQRSLAGYGLWSRRVRHEGATEHTREGVWTRPIFSYLILSPEQLCAN